MSIFDQITDMLRHVPSEARATFKEVSLLLEQGDFEKAEKKLALVISKYPNLESAYKLLGETYHLQKRYSEALEAFDLALSKRDTPELRVRAVEEALELQHFDEAFQHLRVLQRLPSPIPPELPNQPSTYRFYLLAEANMRTERFRLALHYINIFLDKINYFSSLQDEKNLSIEAENTNEDSIRITPESMEEEEIIKHHKTNGYRLKVDALSHAGEDEEALLLFEKFTHFFSYDPDFSERRYKLFCNLTPNSRFSHDVGEFADIVSPRIDATLTSVMAVALANYHIKDNNPELAQLYLNAVRGGLSEEQRLMYDRCFVKCQLLSQTNGLSKSLPLSDALRLAGERLLTYQKVSNEDLVYCKNYLSEDIAWSFLVAVTHIKGLLCAGEEVSPECWDRAYSALKPLRIDPLLGDRSGEAERKELLRVLDWYLSYLSGRETPELTENVENTDIAKCNSLVLSLFNEQWLYTKFVASVDDPYLFFLYRAQLWSRFIKWEVKEDAPLQELFLQFQRISQLFIETIIHPPKQTSLPKSPTLFQDKTTTILPSMLSGSKLLQASPLSVILQPLLEEASLFETRVRKNFFALVEKITRMKKDAIPSNFNEIGVYISQYDLERLRAAAYTLWGNDPEETRQLRALESLLAAREGEQRRPLRIAIVGEFNAGKSSLINTLLGDNILPTGVLPTTAQLVTIQWGPVQQVIIYDSENNKTIIPFEEFAQVVRENGERIHSVTLELPHPLLLRFELVDSPGFNALADRHDQLAAHVLRESDLLLWVMDINQALSSSELQRIKAIDFTSLRLHVVLNKVDRVIPHFHEINDISELPASEDIEKVKAFVSKELGDCVASISLLSTVQNKEKNVNPLFSSFWKDFFTNILEKGDEIKAARFSSELEYYRKRLETAKDKHIEKQFSEAIFFAKKFNDPEMRICLLELLHEMLQVSDKTRSNLLKQPVIHRIQKEIKQSISSIESLKKEEVSSSRHLPFLEKLDGFVKDAFVSLELSFYDSSQHFLDRELASVFDKESALSLLHDAREEIFDNYRLFCIESIRKIKEQVFKALNTFFNQEIALLPEDSLLIREKFFTTVVKMIVVRTENIFSKMDEQIDYLMRRVELQTWSYWRTLDLAQMKREMGENMESIRTNYAAIFTKTLNYCKLVGEDVVFSCDEFYASELTDLLLNIVKSL